MSAPKLFVSYCWSNQDHEQYVLHLAADLRENGIDVILDKWDLKEGHDAIAFMEKMVSDPSINKVIMICDEEYSARADGRRGGVGTETQIISPAVYSSQSQDKFVAVVAARDAQGKPFLPTYYKSRIYIDLTESDRYSLEFEKLVRWVFDKPLHVKPEIGTTPDYLKDSAAISLGTRTSFRRCLEAVKAGRPSANGALDEYCNLLAGSLEKLRIKESGKEDFDELVLKSIDEFIPFRNEFISVVGAIAQYAPQEVFVDRLHRFFEDSIHYLTRPQGISQWREWDFDNFSFILHELFLYTIAIFTKQQCFDHADRLLGQRYYAPQIQSDRGITDDPMTSFSVFYDHLKSLDFRNQRLKLNRTSLRADILQKRCAGIGAVQFKDLMQADFIAYFRSELHRTRLFVEWLPETLVFRRSHSSQPLEVFARSSSVQFFARSKVLLGVGSKEDLHALLAKYADGSRELPRFGYHYTVNPAVLIGYEKLATER